MPIRHDPSRDETTTNAGLGVLSQRFGNRIETGLALRSQHAHTTTWLPNQPPDAVFCPRTTQEVQVVMAICNDHRMPVIPFGTARRWRVTSMHPWAVCRSISRI